MKKCLVLVVVLALVGMVFGVEPAKPAKAPEPTMKMAAGSAKIIVEPVVKEFTAMKAAIALEKAAAYAPKEGYAKDQAGISLAYSSMAKDGFDKLMKWCHATSTWPSGPGFMVCNEDPSVTETAKLTTKIGFPVKGDAKGDSIVTIEEVPAMTAAMLQYQGPYEDANNAWTTIMNWMKTNNCEPAGPPLEVYLKGPMDVKDPKEYLTEIRFPVKKPEAKKAEEAPKK